MEYKYSFIGDCGITYSSVADINRLFDKSFSRETSHEVLLAGQFPTNRIVPVYLFKNASKGTVKIAPNRIDFVFDKEDNDELLKSLFHLVFKFLPSKSSRIAINISNAIDDSDKNILKAISKKDSLAIDGSSIEEYLIRKNFRSVVKGLTINNIITIQNAMVKASGDFGVVNGLVYSIDVNNVPVGLDPKLGKDIELSDVESVFMDMCSIVSKDKEIIQELIKIYEKA